MKCAVLIAVWFVAANASAAERVQEWRGPAENVDVLSLDNRLGSVEVRGWDRPEIRVTATKRSPRPELIDRLRVHVTTYDDGHLVVDTRVKLEGGELILPLETSRVDLVVDAPRSLKLAARTWSGDLTASGMRSGARLETDAGRIDASDLVGPVATKGRRSDQRITLIRGDVDVDDIEGDVLLQQISGDRVMARLVRGSLKADRVLAQTISLLVMMGRVEFVVGDALVDLRARSRGGRVAVEGHGENAFFRGVLGGSPESLAHSRVELTSYGGDVWVSQMARKP